MVTFLGWFSWHDKKRVMFIKAALFTLHCLLTWNNAHTYTNTRRPPPPKKKKTPLCYYLGFPPVLVSLVLSVLVGAKIKKPNPIAIFTFLAPTTQIKLIYSPYTTLSHASDKANI